MKQLLTILLIIFTLSVLAQTGGQNTVVISADQARYNAGYSVSVDNDFASKKYVDDMVTSTGSIKEECDAATTSNKTLSDTIIIDGVQTHAGYRILVKDQTNPVSNGIYTVVKGGSWTRALDFDTWGEIYRSSVFILGGTVNAGMTYTSIVDTTGTVGVDTIQFSTSYQIDVSAYKLDSIYTSGGAVYVRQGDDVYNTDPLYTTGTITENIAGLEFSNTTRQVIGGSTVLNLSSGYLIPTTALKTNWDAGYNNSPSAISIRDTTIASVSYKYIKLTRTSAPSLYSNTFTAGSAGSGVNLTGSPGLILTDTYLYQSDYALTTLTTPASGDYIGIWDISSTASYKQCRTSVENLGTNMLATLGGLAWSGGVKLNYTKLTGETPELSDTVSFWDISGNNPKASTITTLFSLIPTMSTETRGMATLSGTTSGLVVSSGILKQSDYNLPTDESSLLGDTDYIGFCNSAGNEQYKTTLLALKNYIGVSAGYWTLSGGSIYYYNNVSIGTTNTYSNALYVDGKSTSADAIYAKTSSSTNSVSAITGSNSSSGYGVTGSSNTGNGLHGVSSTGIGVVGNSLSGYGGSFGGLGVNITAGGLSIKGVGVISSNGDVSSANGASGSFTSSDGKTITVINGIITSIN